MVVFVDEVKQGSESNWAYIGMVSVPEHRLKRALDALLQERQRVGYHRELHFQDIKNRGEKAELAKAWLSLVMEDPLTWHFGILGLDMSKLCLPVFGERAGQQFGSAYRRFVRAQLLYHLKTAYCRNSGVEIAVVYHDRSGQLERDEYFDWHGIHRLSVQEPLLSFSQDRIVFVDSNHETAGDHADASHFIQLTDVILGATRQSIERPSTKRPGADEVARHFLPLVERLNHKRDWRNPNGRYRHYPRCHLSFFPTKPLTVEMLQDERARATSTFYRGRVLRLAELKSGQMTLDLNFEQAVAASARQ